MLTFFRFFLNIEYYIFQILLNPIMYAYVFCFVLFSFLHHSSRRLVLLFPLIDGRLRSQAISAKAG